MKPLRVTVIGTLDQRLPRTRTLIQGLELANCEVAVRSVPLWGEKRSSLPSKGRLALALRALVAIPRLIWAAATAPRSDAFLVGYPGHLDVLVLAPIARLRRIPLVWDVFISLHNTVVEDRQLASANSMIGRFTRWLDVTATRLASLVLADTRPHAEYFAKLAGIPMSRCAVVPVGAQQDVFFPIYEVEPEPRSVLFYGTFVPLQGVSTIIRAAKLLEPDGVTVRVIGRGQDGSAVDDLIADLAPSNLERLEWVPLAQLPREIARAEVCLGVFGTSSKAARVVPNKVYECVAMGRPVVTADTPAIRSIFHEGELALVEPGDPAALADTIRRLLDDPDERATLGKKGRERYELDLATPLIGARVRDEVLALTGAEQPAWT